MRKGRSQRKARVSLPPRTARQQPSHADVGSGEVAPRVVTGVAGSRPDAGQGESDAHARSDGRSDGHAHAEPATSVDSPRKRTLEMFAEPTLELLRQSDPVVVAAEHAGRAAHLPQLPTPDEMSIPPAGDLAVEPVADRFFSEGEILASRPHLEEPEWDAVVARESRKSLPEVVERRARLAKYVRWAVGGAALVCVAALGRTFVAPASHASANVSVVNAVQAPPVEAPQAPVLKAAMPAAVAEPVAPPAAEPAKTAELAAAPAGEPEPARVDAPKVEIPKAEEPAAAAAPAPSDKTALQEKNDCRRALERGKAADAIAAGERSVALDPTDGEAWLLLGAAHQDKGNMAEARRAYTSCTTEGKRGPIGECRAMLR